MVTPPMGRLKGYNGSRHHLQSVASETASNLKVRWWLERLNGDLIKKLQRNSPAFCDEEVNLDQASQYQDIFVHF